MTHQDLTRRPAKVGVHYVTISNPKETPFLSLFSTPPVSPFFMFNTEGLISVFLPYRIQT